MKIAFFVLAYLAPRTGSMGYRKRVISGGTDIATLLASVSDIFALSFFPVAGGRVANRKGSQIRYFTLPLVLVRIY